MGKFTGNPMAMEDGRLERPHGRKRPASIVKDFALTENEGIRQGLEDAKQGRTRPAREFFAELEAKFGVTR
jgi:hypothetical protein